MAGKFFLYKYQVGDIVTMRKSHPCGSKNWEVLRIGAEIKLKCAKCGHEFVMSRPALEKATVSVVAASDTSNSNESDKKE